MKRAYALLLLASVFIVSCSETPTENIPQEIQIDMSDFYVYTDDDLSHKSTSKHSGDKCYSMKVLNEQLKSNPSLYNKMYAVEKHSRQFIAGKKGGNGNGNGNNGGGDSGGGGGEEPVDDGLGSITIPVHVYVIYANSQQNISDTQIKSQIDVLNADFNDSNFSDIPAEFEALGAQIDINFNLVQTEKFFDETSNWGTNNAVKNKYPAVDGHLTIWVANIGGGILGYAQFPGGNASTDGIVVSPQYFGTTGTVSYPFNEGRTATHEVGHWLNLRHIWGDGRCRQDDFVADTPSSDRPNYGCPTYPTAHCRSNDMTMNYMDYTYDACMNMFTQGQKERMRALFASGGARVSWRN